jgi:signal transduction histidine kinase
VQLILRKTDEEDPRREGLLEIRKAVDRAAALIRQLLAFSRTQVMRPCALSLPEVVGGMEGMLRGVLPESVDLLLELHPETPAVLADAGQLEQVLMNLVVNAGDAMPEGGRVAVRTTGVDGAEGGLAAGRYAMLTVSDQGTGIDAAILESVFEPFFTTKEEGKGTGLGLSTVYGIVTQSGGTVRAESTPGVETTFRIFLPAVSPGVPQQLQHPEMAS